MSNNTDNSKKNGKKNMERRAFLTLTTSFSLLLAAPFYGCSLTGGKKKESELSAAPVEDYGLERTTKKLIVKIDNMEFLRVDRKENPETAICFFGITNSQGEQVPELNEAVKRQFQESTSYRLLSDSKIDKAVKDAGIKRNDIYLPDERKKFVETIDDPVRYFVSGQIFPVSEESNVPGEPIGDQIVYDLVSVKDDEQATIQDRLASFYNGPVKKKGLF